MIEVLTADTPDQLEAVRTGTGGTTQPQDEIHRQALAVQADVERAAKQVNALYTMLAGDLNSPSALYTVTSGLTSHAGRRSSLKQLALWGVLLALIAVPVVLTAAFVHYRIAIEEDEEAGNETRQ